MTMSDPIADMLTRIRNANTAKHDTVDVPASKLKVAIAGILVDEGYIAKYDLVENGAGKNIHITMKYNANKTEKIITGIKRISKPGLRIYAGKEEIPYVSHAHPSLRPHGTGRPRNRYFKYQQGHPDRQAGSQGAGRRRGSRLCLVIRQEEIYDNGVSQYNFRRYGHVTYWKNANRNS